MQGLKVIVSIIELFILIVLYIKLGTSKSKLSEYRLELTGLVVVQILYSFTLPFFPLNIRPIITTGYPLAMGLYINLVLLKNNYIQAVINTFSVAVLLLVSQLFSLLVLQMVIGADLANNIIYIVGQIFYLMIMIVIYTFLQHSIRKINRQISDFLELKGFNVLFKLIPYGLLLMVLIYIMVQLIYTNNLRETFLGIWSLATLLIILTLFSITNISRAELRNKVLETELIIEQEKTHQLEAYEIIMSEVKGFWHNYSNIIQVLTMALEADEFVSPELKNAIQEYVDEDMSEVRDNIRLTKINNPILFAAVTLAERKAKALNVKLIVESYGQGIISINSKELSEIISVLLDNAMEVAYYADKTVDIEINLGEEIEITIINQYIEENGTVKKYGTSNNIGIESIKAIVAKYENVLYEVTKEKGTYKAQIRIK